MNRAMQHRSEAGLAERAENFLRLAERVTEQHRRDALLQRFPAKGHDLAHHFLGGREPVARQAKGRLHDEGVGPAPFRRLGREPGAQLEVARVKDGARVRLAEKLGRPKNVAGREKRHLQAGPGPRFAESQDMLAALARQPCLHQARGSLGNDDLAVGRDMVAVRVRDKGEFPGVPWIQPEIMFREMNAPLKPNVDHAGDYAWKVVPETANQTR